KRGAAERRARPAALRGGGRGAGAGARPERGRAGGGVRVGCGARTPASIEAGAQEVVEKIVARGNRLEHRRDARGRFVGRGHVSSERPAASHADAAPYWKRGAGSWTLT